MSSGVRNKWLQESAKLDILHELDECLMDGWAQGITLGELIDSLPRNLRDTLLNLNLGCPEMTEFGFDLHLLQDPA